ncbi:hypothetical protein HER10_EVM0007671 [Colletotrichum scovillei]|uniref:uncharacterized protein n=1 Tax=Colletotrichum scovillei TaxID=1209932 RepID=UPI0015C3F94F|nr:uncharacterized protein HER10_EVM0007671 [Colletotrichum scovillei]KAF4782099.1 hypothetical protein HER10_EVM0007671 [Colletotrichum scovillei]
MANPQPPFTGAGAGANILTPNSNASNLKPITKIRLLPSKPMLTPPTTTGTTTPRPGTKPKAIKLKLKASSSSSPASGASRRRKLHRQENVAGSRQSSEPGTPPISNRHRVNRVNSLGDAHPRVTSNGTSQNSLEIRNPTPPPPASTTGSTSKSHSTRPAYPLSAFSAAAAAAAANANANPKKRPRVLISTRNLAWMRASNGVWVKVPLAGWKEKQMRPVT